MIMAKRRRQGGMSLNRRNSAMMGGGDGSGQSSKGGGRATRGLNAANSAMTPTPGMQRPGRAPSSVILNARSSRPTSILNGGKQTFGPLAWRGNAVDYTGGVKKPFRGSR